MIGQSQCAVTGEDNFLVSLRPCSLLAWYFIQHFDTLKLDQNISHPRAAAEGKELNGVFLFPDRKQYFSK